MKNSKKNDERRINFTYDGNGFVYINPEFIKEEREKILAMAPDGAVDYLLYNSEWSIAYRKDGWQKENIGKTVVYRRTQHIEEYVDILGCMIEERHIETLSIRKNMGPVYVRCVTGTLTYDDGTKEREDPILEMGRGDEAIDVVVNTQQASTSFIQRKFKVGYARAGRIIDQMEERGIVSGYQGSKPRTVLMPKERWEELKMAPSDTKDNNNDNNS